MRKRQRCEQFFAAAEGTLNGFTFLDPAGNLLAWSDQLDNAVWQKDPLLSLTAGVADPRGGTRPGDLQQSRAARRRAIAQTLAAPGGYQYCFSAYVRAAQPTSVRLSIGGQTARAGGDQRMWTRIACAGSRDGGRDVDAVRDRSCRRATRWKSTACRWKRKPAASGYKASTRGGVYEDAHLRDDVLTITTTGVNRHSCTVNIIHANHL